MYRKLRDAGYSVTITDAAHLEENRFGIRVLYVPHMSILSPQEKEALNRFMNNGGVVYENSYTGHSTMCIGFKRYEDRVKPYEERVYDLPLSVHDVADLTGVYPQAVFNNPNVGMQLLQADGYKLVILTNISVTKKKVNAQILFRDPITSVQCFAMDGDKTFTVSGQTVTVDDITDGCILRVEESAPQKEK
jgi:predicted DNA-binding protein YlxM (UPF0122 family)